MSRRLIEEAAQCHQAGQLEESERMCRKILSSNPKDAGALYLLGVLYWQLGRRGESLDCLKKAARHHPKSVDIQLNLGIALRDSGHPERAAAAFQTAADLDPRRADLWDSLGWALSLCGRAAEAESALRRAVRLHPQHAGYRAHLAGALNDLGRLDEAAEHARAAMAATPDHYDALAMMGCVLQKQARPQDALPYFERACQLAPDRPRAHWNLAVTLLQAGHLERGLAEAEWRDRAHDVAAVPPQPKWGGAALDGTLLVHHEQGLGDALMMARYLPVVAERARRVVVSCPPHLGRLLRASQDVAEVVECDPMQAPPVEADARIGWMSLPHVLGTRLESIPAAVPYLRAPDDGVARWGERLAGGDGLRVGIVWAGNPRQSVEAQRGCGLRALAPLAAVPGVRLFSLQKGPGRDQMAAPPPGMAVIDLADEIADFADTAAAIMHLDVVVTTDTSVPHLAGALGRPVWTLLSYAPDWRWMLDRDDSPWYPTMRLFRQRTPGDWTDPIARIASSLAENRKNRGQSTE